MNRNQIATIADIQHAICCLKRELEIIENEECCIDNDGTNLGTQGSAWFKGKDGITFQFRRAKSVSEGLTIEEKDNVVEFGLELPEIPDLQGCCPQTYSHNGAIITATGEGVEFTTSNGVGTVTVPEDVFLLSFGLSGDLAFLDGGNYRLNVNYSGSRNFNNSLESMLVPNVEIIETASQLIGGPNQNLPFNYTGTQTPNAPQRHIVAVGDGNISLRFVNLNGYTQWHLKLNF